MKFPTKGVFRVVSEQTGKYIYVKNTSKFFQIRVTFFSVADVHMMSQAHSCVRPLIRIAASNLRTE